MIENFKFGRDNKKLSHDVNPSEIISILRDMETKYSNPGIKMMVSKLLPIVGLPIFGSSSGFLGLDTSDETNQFIDDILNDIK